MEIVTKIGRPPIPLEHRFWTKVRKTDGCWEWTACKDPNGYGRFTLCGRARSNLAHRIAYELINGPIQSGKVLCHKCDNPSCVNPSHMFVGTQGDNVDDMNHKERQAIGIDYPQTKLSTQDVVEIKRLYGTGNYTQMEIGRIFGVGQDHISRLINNHRRKKLDLEVARG